MRVLLVNPPIHDFTAFDFWMRPYGMQRVAGQLHDACDLVWFDFLVAGKRDGWGRGRFPEQMVSTPAVFGDLRRRFRRYGRPRKEFRELLIRQSVDLALIQTGMTYWYLGVREVIEDVRELAPRAIIVLGGIYATLCPDHARSLGADIVIEGSDLTPLRQIVSLVPGALPYRTPSMGTVAAMKLTEGCPFHCTYCSVPLQGRQFAARPAQECLAEARRLASTGGEHVAFYDDALLYQPDRVLLPFLEGVMRERLPLSFHTPNALHARFVTRATAELMVEAGFRNFFLGFESVSAGWLKKTGPKSLAEEFASAVDCLRAAGGQSITAYIIIGHPDDDDQQVESSMNFAHEQGARIMLSEFAPVPGTRDGEICRKWSDLDEPLLHNKTAFTIRRLGSERVQRLKAHCRDLNSRIPKTPSLPAGQCSQRAHTSGAA